MNIDPQPKFKQTKISSEQSTSIQPSLTAFKFKINLVPSTSVTNSSLSTNVQQSTTTSIRNKRKAGEISQNSNNDMLPNNIGEQKIIEESLDNLEPHEDDEEEEESKTDNDTKGKCILNLYKMFSYKE